ncbi:MAG: hypothetical protein ACSLEX_02025 [Minisyncoccota bacterium]
MELKEYFRIFREQSVIFWGITIAIVAIALVWYINQPIRYQATLLLNIGRTGTQDTQDYTYDSFYRLQADERFADTVVRWLSAPRIVEDIYQSTAVEVSSNTPFVAKRLSSQVIEVTYSNANVQPLKDIAMNMTTVLNQYAVTLNQGNQETNWFVIIGSEPVITDARISLPLTFAVAVVCGLFFGFWGTLFRHYWQTDSK